MRDVIETGRFVYKNRHSPEFSPPSEIRLIKEAHTSFLERAVEAEFDPIRISQDPFFKDIASGLRRLRGNLTERPEVSVVVPARNEMLYLLGLLYSLSLQKTNLRTEVVVIDNNSDRKDLTAYYGAMLSTNWISFIMKNGSIGYARNLGILQAESPLIVMTDADAIMPSHYIDSITDPFVSANYEGERPSVVIGHVHYHDDPGMLFKIPGSHRVPNLGLAGFRYIHTRRNPIPKLLAFGPNTVFRKEDIKRVGGYPKTSSNEDLEVVNRLGQIGKVEFIDSPDTTVWVSSRRLNLRMLPRLIGSGLIGRDFIHAKIHEKSVIR